jgi:hypothetical protein
MGLNSMQKSKFAVNLLLFQKINLSILFHKALKINTLCNKIKFNNQHFSKK